MKDTRDAITRLEAILNALDALGAEALDDLNAEFEDALMLLDALDPVAEREEYADTLEAIRALAGDYRGTGIARTETFATKIEETTEKELGMRNEE